MVSASDIYSVHEAAERLGVPRRTLRRWIANDKIKVLKRLENGQTIFDRAEVERLREARVTNLRRRLASIDPAA